MVLKTNLPKNTTKKAAPKAQRLYLSKSSV